MADRDGGRSHLAFCRKALDWGSAVYFDRLFARRCAGMVGKCQAIAAQQFPTIL